MVTGVTLSKLLSAKSRKEIEAVVNKLSEADAKAYLIAVFTAMNRDRTDDLMKQGFPVDHSFEVE